jgi:hypothetical protein
VTFTYAGTFTTDLDKVRFEVGDTVSANALFTDEEIAYKLGEYPNVLLCAAALCEVLATRYAGDYKFKTDDQEFDRSTIAANYRARAEALRGRVSGSGLSTVGFTRVDGHSDDLDSREGANSAIEWALNGELDDLP